MLELLSSHACHGGEQRIYRHDSQTIGLPMRFAIYLPPQALQANANVPALFYLAGLTCTEETFPVKAGAQRFAAQHGIALIAPDTSPRGAGVPGESTAWDFGVRRGLLRRCHAAAVGVALPDVFSTCGTSCAKRCSRICRWTVRRLGIFGHSMGGHGALMLALRNPEIYRSVSAFAPIAAPTPLPVGREGVQRLSGRRPRSVEAVRRERTGRACVAQVRSGDSGRSGARGSVPRGATESGCVRSRLQGRRSTADVASSCGLRPRLLLHLDVHRNHIAHHAAIFSSELCRSEERIATR